MTSTIQYLKKVFSDYYSQHVIKPPERFGRREWGFFFFQGKGMQRHISFNRIEELKEFLVSSAPRHVYYSSAYYQHPDIQPMSQKVEGWLGTDLIFDLDDEHLSGMEGLSPKQKLERVKRIIKDRLLDDFLLGDFGFKPEFVMVSFSGGRGYHIHIKDPKVLTLNSPERREIVDYLTSTGIKWDRIFTKEVYEVKSFGRHRVPKEMIRSLYDEKEGGWRGRVTMGIFKLLKRMENYTKKECMEFIQQFKFNNKNISEHSARNIYNELFKGNPGERGIDTIRNERVIEIFSNDRNRDIFIELALEEVRVNMAGETDEPVTVDTRRLIRFPGSLHGKTGLKVVVIPIDELESFDPFRDAIAFDDSDTKIILNSDVSFELCDNNFKLSSGEHTLPRYAAVYLMCRGAADIKQT